MAKNPIRKTLQGQELLKMLEITDRHKPVRWVRADGASAKLDIERAIVILRTSLDYYEGVASLTRVYSLRELSAPPVPVPSIWRKTATWCASFRAHQAPVLQPAYDFFERMGYGRGSFFSYETA